MKNIDLKSYGSLFGLIGEDKFSCDNIEHKLFTTNIGLSISNSYEKISINTNQNLDFWSMTALAMIFVVPDIYVPYALQVLFIKVPEIALAYIIFRLIRGGG
jgi:hypothetical protein